MLKGDLRKKQILDTAERLFCEKGYEDTSIQDILDILHISKGSFYHHYESKDMLLRGMCERHSESAAEKYAALNPPENYQGIERLHQVLRNLIPFNGEGLHFLTMLLPVFTLPEGRSIRDSYQEALKKAFFSAALEALGEAVASREAWCENPEMTIQICVDLTNDMWTAVSDEMIRGIITPDSQVDLAKMLGIAEAYRRSLENLLTAPYGSLILLNLEDLQKLSNELSVYLSRPGRR